MERVEERVIALRWATVKIVALRCVITDANLGRENEMTRGNDRLSRAATALRRIYDAHLEGAEYDAGFDAGEFSGPEHARAMQRDIAAALDAFGFTVESYNRALINATSDRFAHFSGLEA